MSKRKPYIPRTPRFSRGWFLGGARNLLWVLLVTALVWVYADMEFTTEQDYRLTVRLTTGSAENLTFVSSDDAGLNIDMTFKLQGNRSQLDTFRRWLNDRNGVLAYDVSRYQPGKEAITDSAGSVLDRIVNFPKQGLTLLWANPATISFHLDWRIRVPNIPVEFQYTGVTLAGPPVIEPAKVAIYVSETAWKEIEAALPEPARKLKTRQVDLKNLPTDKPITAEIIPSITVRPDEPPVPVTPSVDSVTVKVQVQQVIGTKTFNVTPRIGTPSTWLDDNTWAEYKFVLKPSETWTREIKVQGAKTDVESLKNEDIDAYIMLQDGDKKWLDSWLSRAIVVRFPPELKVELAPGEKPIVSFKLEKRTGPPGP